MNPFSLLEINLRRMLIMIIRTVTMDDLNEVVELESDAFKMTKSEKGFKSHLDS